MSKIEEEAFDQEGFEWLQRQAQEYEAKLKERLGKFNINDVLRQAKDLRSIFVSDLGEVRYVLLSEADISDIPEKYSEDARDAICRHFSSLWLLRTQRSQLTS